MKADIWSLGITGIELAKGKPPLYEIPSMRVIFMIPQRDPPKLENPDKFSPEFTDFLAVCLKMNPLERPTSKELLEHPFIKRGMENKPLLKEMVQETVPFLQAAREKRKQEEDKKVAEEDDDDRTLSFRAGTTISINTATGSVTMSSGALSSGFVRLNEFNE